jgi:hypothetical protein
MKSASFRSLILLICVLILAACAPAAAETMPAAPTAAVPTIRIVISSPTPTPEPTTVPLSFTPATYKVESEGFELDYPADWTSVPFNQVGSRGSQGLLLSPGTTAEMIPAGGSRVSLTVYLWDPKNDLAAYAAHRRGAWDSGGYSIVKESSGDLMDGRKYMSYVVRAPDDQQAFFLVTSLGQSYLEIAGEGNLALVEEIARTMRPLGIKP